MCWEANRSFRRKAEWQHFDELAALRPQLAALLGERRTLDAIGGGIVFAESVDAEPGSAKSRERGSRSDRRVASTSADFILPGRRAPGLRWAPPGLTGPRRTRVKIAGAPGSLARPRILGPASKGVASATREAAGSRR
jgi:hypothetical protein